MTPEEIVNKFAKMTMFPRQGNWMFIDLYNQLWQIKYTGSRTAPFEISLVEDIKQEEP
jgi:hypothetical protein